MYRLSATLDAFAPFLPPALVEPDALERARRAADHLPAALTERLCLECRLGNGEPRTDLVVGVEARGREILVDGVPAAALGPALRGAGGWAEVAGFCREWRDERSPLHREVERLWLEFDLPAGGEPAAPRPGVFVDFTAAACASGTPEERCARIARALLALLGRGPGAGAAAGVLRCLRALPAGASVPYVGVLIPRGTGPLRLCVSGVEEERLPGFLRAAGWPGRPGALERLLAGARACAGPGGAPRVDLLHLDVGDGVHERIGLEFAFARREQVRGRLREAAFLDFLVERGLCAPGKREALLAWPGCAVERLPHELWPSVALRHLAHVKVVLDGEGVREAKAYLSLRHAPRPTRAVERAL